MTALAAGLIAAGISQGDRIGLMSATDYEWALCDLAILTAGAVTVPVYETSSVAQVAWILRDSGAAAVFVANDELRATVEQADAVDVKHVWLMTPKAAPNLRRSAATSPPSGSSSAGAP